MATKTTAKKTTALKTNGKKSPANPPNNAGLPGTQETAVKKQIPIKMDGALAALAPLAQKTTYTGCSRCEYNLEQFVQTNTGIELKDIEICPGCSRTFVVDDKCRCYACGIQMTDTGDCVSCGAKRSDPEQDKILTIYVQMNEGKKGRIARLEARKYVADPALVARLMAQGKKEGWIDRYEKSSSPTTQGNGYEQRPARTTF